MAAHKDLTPAFPTHPGEVVKEELQTRKVSQRELADSIGMSYTMLNEILNGKRPVTVENALVFEAALGISADMLTNMQNRYSLIVARQDKKNVSRLDAIRRVCASLLA